MRTVVEESECTSSAGGVVDDLCHHRSVFLKEEFVANPYLSCWFHEHVPETLLLVEFPEQEYLNLCIGLLLSAIETCWKDLGVVKDEDIALVEIVDHVTEGEVSGMFVDDLSSFVPYLFNYLVAVTVFLVEFYLLAFLV